MADGNLNRNRRRRRRSTSEEKEKERKGSVSQKEQSLPSPDNNETGEVANGGTATGAPWSVSLVVAWFVSMASVSMVSHGLVIRSDFHSAQECEMTWSRYKYIALQGWSSSGEQDGSLSSPYRLLKFVDRRDVRFHHLYEGDDFRDATTAATPDGDGHGDEWCRVPPKQHSDAFSGARQQAPRNRVHPVLFIPGHWGEYRQSRSLGAHGTRLTRQYHSPAYQDEQARQVWQAATSPLSRDQDLSNFYYDVYTMDFAEEGGALHGSRLLRQTEAVAMAVQTIANACNATQVTLVGHSIGGLVARAVTLLHPSIRARGLVRSVITLATPHDYSPYAWDAEMHRFYHALHDHRDDNVALVSISGGLRDELIPPVSCRLHPQTGLTVLTSTLSKTPQTTTTATTAGGTPRQSSNTDSNEKDNPSFGVDHKGIVWCHDVLSAVRVMIFLLQQRGGEASPQDRLDRVRQHLQLHKTDHSEEAYSAAVKRQQDSFVETYGFWRSSAIMSTTWYTLVNSAIVAMITLLTFLGLCALLSHHVLHHPGAISETRQIVLRRGFYLFVPPVVEKLCCFFVLQRPNLVHHTAALVISYNLLTLYWTAATVVRWWRRRRSQRRQQERRLHQG